MELLNQRVVIDRNIVIDDRPRMTLKWSGQATKPRDRKLTLAELKIAYLLVGGSNGGGELFKGQPPRFTKRADVVRQWPSVAVQGNN